MGGLEPMLLHRLHMLEGRMDMMQQIMEDDAEEPSCPH
jgi:hypothetical protein